MEIPHILIPTSWSFFFPTEFTIGTKNRNRLFSVTKYRFEMCPSAEVQLFWGNAVCCYKHMMYLKDWLDKAFTWFIFPSTIIYKIIFMWVLEKSNVWFVFYFVIYCLDSLPTCFSSQWSFRFATRWNFYCTKIFYNIPSKVWSLF